MDSRFTRIKARYLLLWLLLSMVIAAVLVAAADDVLSLGSDNASQVLAESTFAWALDLVLLAATIAYARRAGVAFRASFGVPPTAAAVARIGVVAVPLVALSSVLFYVVFAPLSLVWPDAVQSWLFDYVPLFYSAEAPYPWPANLLGMAAVVIMAPITEEWFFRGLLLPRLQLKWGTVAGVIISSLTFGVMHTDIVGATLFGIAMCAVYARTGSLWAPAIVHAVNNGIAAAFVLLDAHGVVETQVLSVEELRTDVVPPIVGLIVAGLWIPRVWAAWRPMAQWHFGPALSPGLEPSAPEHLGSEAVSGG